MARAGLPDLHPAPVEALRPCIEEITSALLDDLAGLPGGQEVDLRHIVEEVFRTSATPEETATTAQAMVQFLAELVEHKRQSPGDDLTSGLLAARDEQRNALSERELVDTLILKIGTGRETTVDLLDQAVVALHTCPEQLTLLREEQVSWEDVVDEPSRLARSRPVGAWAPAPRRRRSPNAMPSLHRWRRGAGCASCSSTRRSAGSRRHRWSTPAGRASPPPPCSTADTSLG